MNCAKKLSCCRGQFLIFVALAFVFLGLFIGLAVDGGRVYLLNTRLSKIVDAAALAAAVDLSDFSQAEDRACDWARVNGLTVDDVPGTCPPGVTVDLVGVATTTCPTPPCVSVTAVQPMDTTFMRLGTLIGCGTICETINVAATGIAAPATFLDGVLIMDNTQSMNGTKLTAAKEGATQLVESLVLPGSDANKISLVPFRGCYNDSGSDDCVDVDKIIDLTSNREQLTAGIKGLTDGGGSGTNVCLGLDQGQNRVFGSGARTNAKKIMVILTDGDNHYSGVNAGGDCALGGSSDAQINTLDGDTNAKANAIKGSPNAVEIFVIRYAPSGASDGPAPFPDTPTSTECDAQVGTFSGSRSPDNDPGDRLLGRCIASNPELKNHYFFAPTPEAIQAAFQEIARRLTRRLTA